MEEILLRIAGGLTALTLSSALACALVVVGFVIAVRTDRRRRRKELFERRLK